MKYRSMKNASKQGRLVTEETTEATFTFERMSSARTVSAKKKRRTVVRASVLGGIVVIVIFVLVFAAHYQPIALNGGVGGGSALSTPHSKSDYESLSFVNRERFGITVEAVDGVVAPNLRPGTHVSATERCPSTKKSGGACSNNNAKGIPGGLPFHSFSMNGGTEYALLWHFVYDCNDVSPGSNTVEIPVTYKFLFFTRTVVLRGNALESACQ